VPKRARNELRRVRRVSLAGKLASKKLRGRRPLSSYFVPEEMWVW
jgi:hypothetical protein